MTLMTILAVLTQGQAAVVTAQLVALVAVVVTFTTAICATFKIPAGAWNGWARRLISWLISIGLIFLCFWLAPYGDWVPKIPTVFEPWWGSCILEGVLLGGLANGLWTQEWVQKILEKWENLITRA